MSDDATDPDPASRATRALVGTRFGPVEWVGVTGSTNDDLLAAVRTGDREGWVRVADHQTAGRGRRDRRWVTAPGDALLVSVVLGFDDESSAASIATTVVATAATEALHELGFGQVSIKWPNDLVVGDAGHQRKLAGILAQAERRGDRVAVVVGMGCNMVGDRLEAPGAIALSELGEPPARVDLLVAVLRRLDSWLARIDDDGGAALRRRWRELCSTIGTDVRVDLGDRVVEGRAVDVTRSGALVVAAGDGETIEVVVGDVLSLRPGSSPSPR